MFHLPFTTMPYYSLFIHLSIFIFSILTSSSSSTPKPFPPTSVASSQLKFWSENVIGNMPKTLISKLSPLSIQDMKHFATLASKKSLKMDAKFCSLANVDLSSKVVAHFLSKIYTDYRISGTGMAPKLEQSDPNSFFKKHNLKKGNLVQIPDLHSPFPSRSFLPNEISSRIDTSNINDIEMIFPKSLTSSTTKDAILLTLSYCNAPNLKGEIKSCPKSLKETIGFAKNVLGKNVVAVASKSAKGSGTELEINEIKEFPTQKIVSCHEVYFPFMTYYCHLLTSTRLYTVDLIEPETRSPVNSVLAICHMDTSKWSKSHPSFHILKSSPGQTEACHWFSQTDLVWLAK